jgi:hypothetical protein
MASIPSSSAAGVGVDERLFNELEQRYVSLRAEADLLVVDRDMIKGSSLRFSNPPKSNFFLCYSIATLCIPHNS